MTNEQLAVTGRAKNILNARLVELQSNHARLAAASPSEFDKLAVFEMRQAIANTKRAILALECVLADILDTIPS